MALRCSTPLQPAAPAGQPPSGAPPADGDSPPPRSKRPRTEELGGVDETGRQLPEVETPCSQPPRPWALSLVPEGAALPKPPTPTGTPAMADPSARGGGPTGSWGQPWRSGRPGCPRAPERSSEAQPRDGQALAAVAPTSRSPEAARSGPSPPVPRVGGGGPHGQPGRGHSPASEPAGEPVPEAHSPEETKPALHGVGDTRRVGCATPSRETENRVPPSVQKIPLVEIAKPSSFRDNITITMPHFPADLNSNVPFAYLKEIAKKKNDTFVAYARDFTNIYWSRNRPDAKKRKLQDDKIVVVENDFSGCYESNQPLNNHNTFEGKRGLISLNDCHHSSIQCNVRHIKKNFSITIESAKWEETEMSLSSYIPTRLEKCQNWDYNIRPVFQRNRRDCWIMKNFETNCENMQKLAENLNLVQILEGDHLNKEDYQGINISMHDQQSELQVIRTLNNPQNLIEVSQLNDKGENDSMLQLSFCTIQKDFHLNNIFQSLITEIYFLKSILGNKKDSSIVTWFKMLKYEKQIGVQNVVTRNMNVNIKSGILSKCLQASVLELLNTVVKANIVSLLKNFSCFIRTENDCELEKGFILKWIVQNYLENILMEGHTVHLKSVLTFSRVFKVHLKPTSKKRKLFYTRQAFEQSKKQNINSFSVTTKNKSFPIFETCEFFPILMDFENIEEVTVTRESSYENASYPEQFMDVENWSLCSFNTVKMHAKSGPEFIQNSLRHSNEINMNNYDLCTKRKQKHKTSHFNFKFIFDNVFNVKEWVMPSNQNTTHSEQMKTMIVTQELNCEKVSSEIEEKTCDFVWEKDVNIKAQSLTNSCQVHKDTKMEKKEKGSFSSMDGMYSLQPVSLLSKKASVEETTPAKQNNGADRKEYESILQERELANSKHFHPENDSTLYGNRQFESDSSEENNECFQDLTAECLSTDTLTIAKDFQMKSKFDLVLEELRMFHEISKENEMLSTVAIYNRKENYLGESNDTEEAKVESQKDLKMVETNKMCISSLPYDMKAGSNIHKMHQSLFKWKAVANNGEQEVTNEYCPGGPEEELFYATSKEDCKKPKRPAFFTDECKEEKYNYLMKGGSHFSHGISRVQPLKTCSRPIRVGLSRKATLKQLHPYLK